MGVLRSSRIRKPKTCFQREGQAASALNGLNMHNLRIHDQGGH